MPYFTIFIPTYNRADTLLRALMSVSTQQDNDLEVVIIDDGSTDNSKAIVSQWQSSVTFPVKYIYQTNQGKTAAHNTMLKHATGELTVLLDSDDLLTDDALSTLRHYWEEAKELPDCAGVECLCADLNSRELLGTPYPQDRMLSNYLEIRQRYDVKGDKLNAIKTSVLQKFPYPRFAGEKHVPPSTVWSRMAHQHNFLHINKILKLVEYQSNGISQGWKDKKTRNPCGYRQYYLEILNGHKRYHSVAELVSAARRYVYLSLLCGAPFIQQLRDIDNKLLYIACYPLGAGKYLIQQLKKVGHNSGG
ncbi:MAG: glycosyltransferase family A protein [Pseudomonadota bacterium]